MQLLLYNYHASAFGRDRKVLRRAFVNALRKVSSTKLKREALDYKQLKALLRDLNIYVKKRELKPLVKSLCGAEGTVTFPNVATIVDLLRDRPDVRRLFNVLLDHQQLSQPHSSTTALNATTVLYFLHVYQHEMTATPADAVALINRFHVQAHEDGHHHVEHTGAAGLRVMCRIDGVDDVYGGGGGGGGGWWCVCGACMCYRSVPTLVFARFHRVPDQHGQHRVCTGTVSGSVLVAEVFVVSCAPPFFPLVPPAAPNCATTWTNRSLRTGSTPPTTRTWKATSCRPTRQ